MTPYLYAALVGTIGFSAAEQWISYRELPRLARFAMIAPSISLMTIFATFAAFEVDLTPEFQVNAALVALIVYFSWKAIGFIVARKEFHIFG